MSPEYLVPESVFLNYTKQYPRWSSYGVSPPLDNSGSDSLPRRKGQDSSLPAECYCRPPAPHLTIAILRSMFMPLSSLFLFLSRHGSTDAIPYTYCMESLKQGERNKSMALDRKTNSTIVIWRNMRLPVMVGHFLGGGRRKELGVYRHHLAVSLEQDLSQEEDQSLIKMHCQDSDKRFCIRLLQNKWNCF